MPLIIASRRTPREALHRRYAGAEIVDVNSRGQEPWIRFSPFFPHGGIPVPFSPGEFGETVEGIWQGLKVFAGEDVDPSKWRIRGMRGIKRGGRVRGGVLGHREGVAGERLLGYAEARRAIYLPTYRWVLEHRLQEPLESLRRLGARGTVVLLDYETNADVNDLSRPLSHAGLIRSCIEDDWPENPSR